jgi:hypothetical protein
MQLLALLPWTSRPASPRTPPRPFVVNATEGVLAALHQRITHSWSFTESILYLLLLDPAAALQRSRAWDPGDVLRCPGGARSVAADDHPSSSSAQPESRSADRCLIIKT